MSAPHQPSLSVTYSQAPWKYKAAGLTDMYFVPPYLFFFLILLKKILIWWHQVFVASCGSFSYGMGGSSPDQGSKLGPPALGAQSFSHWTTRQVLCLHIPYFYSLFSPHHPQSDRVLPSLETSSNHTSSRKSLLITPKGGKVPGFVPFTVTS